MKFKDIRGDVQVKFKLLSNNYYRNGIDNNGIDGGGEIVEIGSCNGKNYVVVGMPPFDINVVMIAVDNDRDIKHRCFEMDGIEHTYDMNELVLTKPFEKENFAILNVDPLNAFMTKEVRDAIIENFTRHLSCKYEVV